MENSTKHDDYQFLVHYGLCDTITIHYVRIQCGYYGPMIEQIQLNHSFLRKGMLGDDDWVV